MTQFDPDAYLATSPAQPVAAGGFDPDAYLRATAQPKGALEQALEPITSYLPTQRQMAQEGVNRMGQGVEQLVSGAKTAVTPTPEGMSPADQAGAGPLSIIKGAGNVALGGLQYATSPISAAYRTIVGQPVENITGIPKEYTEFGAALATPGLGFTRLPTAPTIIKAPAALTKGEEVAAAGQRLGIDIPRAVTSDTTAVQQVGKGVTSIPGVGTPLRQASEAAIGGLGGAAQEVRAAYGSGNTASAGAAAREGVMQALRNGPIKQRVTELYDRVDNLVNPVVTGEMPNTRNLVNTIDARRVNAALPKSGATDELGPALSRGGMNYEGIKDLRTYFGEMQDGNVAIPQGMTGTEVKQIYGALSQDMRLIIAKAGGADGLRAFEQANRAAARWSGIREDLGKILKTQNEEGIFAKIEAMAGSTARGDLNLLGRVRGAVGPQNWDEISSAVIGRMGWPPGGTGFSPDQFLTAYKKMSEEGRRLLFRSTNNASHADAIDDIAKVSERFKELNKFANPSGTAQHSALFAGGAAATATTSALLAGHFIEPITTVGTIVGGRILSHILARPAPARAMARWAEDYTAAAASPTPAKMNKLEASAKIFAASVGKDFGRPDLVNEFMRRLQGTVPAPASDERRSQLNDGRIMSDADERPIAGQQYAMANKLPIPGMGGITAEIDQQAGGGFGRGASVPGPSRRQSKTPMTDAEYRSKHMELQQLKGVVMKLGPMREKLTELGATPEQMSKMNAAEAFKFIKERSPGGMGKVNPGWQDRNQEFIDRIRSMQDELTGAWQNSK